MLTRLNVLQAASTTFVYFENNHSLSKLLGEPTVFYMIKSSNPQVGKKHRLLETARQANAIFCLFAAEGGADDKQICFLLC